MAQYCFKVLPQESYIQMLDSCSTFGAKIWNHGKITLFTTSSMGYVSLCCKLMYKGIILACISGISSLESLFSVLLTYYNTIIYNSFIKLVSSISIHCSPMFWLISCCFMYLNCIQSEPASNQLCLDFSETLIHSKFVTFSLQYFGWKFVWKKEKHWYMEVVMDFSVGEILCTALHRTFNYQNSKGHLFSSFYRVRI